MLTMLTIHFFLWIRIVFLVLIIISDLKIKFVSSLTTKDLLYTGTCVLTIDKNGSLKMVIIQSRYDCLEQLQKRSV